MEAVAARSAPIVSVASYTGIDPIFRGAAQIWNWSSGERLSEFTTVFDGFGRHSISPNGELYVCANWRKGKNGGVACYNTSSGEKIWHRQDLRQVQGIRFSANGHKVYCRVEARPVNCLDSGSGISLGNIRTVDDVVDSPYADLALHSRRRANYTLVGDKTRSIPRIMPAMSDAAFSRESLCLAEYSGFVRCMDCETGNERWRYLPPKGFHVIRLSYQADQCFYGLLFGYEIPETALIRLSPDHGSCTEIGRYSRARKCGGVRYANGDFGDGVFVTAEGAVVSLVDGQVIKHLPFPVTSESRPSLPEVAGLGRHGYGIEQIKNWRERENKAGRASGLEDFYRAFRICFPCRGLGKLVIGVRWRDEHGDEQSEAGPVATLISHHGLDAPKNWLSDELKWDYLYETCGSCKGQYLRLMQGRG
jgi:hypothetical protein